MSKRVALTMIRNEALIIESFIRHNMQFLDAIVFVYDNSCTDNTLEIIELLKEEGYNLYTYNEKMINFSEYVVRNKYINMIVSRMECDFILPLDADEFLATSDGKNTLEELEKIPSDCISILKWKLFLMKSTDSSSEEFIPKRIMYSCSNRWNTYSKVILPVRLIKEKHLVLLSGSHNVSAAWDVERRELSKLYLAHFPFISKEQFLCKVCGGVINEINHHRCGEYDGMVQRILFEKWKHGNLDIIREAQLSYLQEREDCRKEEFDENVDLIHTPLYDDNQLTPEMKYGDLAKKDVLTEFVMQMQMQAIKYYFLEMSMEEHDDAPKLLIYGTGSYAKNILNGLEEHVFDIRAYIDSDEMKEFSRINGKLIISPSLIRCIPYDKIVIGSEKYYQEIRSKLVQIGVKEDEIVTKNWLIEYCVSHGKY